MNETRRAFLGLLSRASLAALPFVGDNFSASFAAAAPSTPPRRSGVRRVRSALFREETIVRHGGSGDIFPLTWSRDGRQLSSFSDGTGFSNPLGKVYNTEAMWVDGPSSDATFQELSGFPGYSRPNVMTAGYYGFSALSVGDRLYLFLSCSEPDSPTGWGWNGLKLIYSSDQGKTWHNQDGSSPVVWETHADQSRDTLVFFDEPQQAFSLVSILQMGQNYRDNGDGYVYGYAPNGNTDGLMNQLVMFRVPKDRLLERTAYEFFGGSRSNGAATWVKNIEARGVVHTFPAGWVSRPREGQNLVQSWVPSVAYIAPLRQYLMVNAAAGVPDDGDWFGHSKASYLGLWTAPDPWGPWTQVYETTAWTPGNDPGARCYSPQIAPKWIASDGLSLWIVWSDFQTIEGKQPYYSFNTQRVDLTLA